MILSSPLLPLLLLLLTTTGLAKTVTYNFNVGWVTANPDGRFERQTIGINGQWPVPTINVDLGDRLIINLHNGMDQTTSLHFHGLFQNGTIFMDGPSMVTQCPVPPGGNITYDFIIEQPGTYWYHAHVPDQYPDGLRGPFIVHDVDDPNKDLYDEEVVLTLSDWYHEQIPVLTKKFISYTNPTGAEPVPDAALFNDTQNLEFKVEPGKTYLVRMINIAAFAGQFIWFEGHTMRVVEVDGVYTEPMEAEMVYMAAAQRVSVLITTKNETTANYAFMGSMDQDLFDTIPEGLNPNVTGWLVYNNDLPKNPAVAVAEFDPFDDFLLVPSDGKALLPDADYTVTLEVTMNNLNDGANYAFFNDITYVPQQVPSLYTALSAGKLADNSMIYGVNSHAIVLNHMDVIDIVLNNADPGKHPFHLHGHVYQVIHRSEEEAGAYNASDPSNPEYPAVPMRRDTVLVHPNGNVILRFRADNPGIWLFHCHIEWHLASGLAVTFIEAPFQLQANTTIPQAHLDICAAQGISTSGNAVGNTVDFFDLTGANVSPGLLPEGFTGRGIAAIAFSVLEAFIGMGFVVWYGLVDARPIRIV